MEEQVDIVLIWELFSDLWKPNCGSRKLWEKAQRRAPAAAAQLLAKFYPKSKKLEIDVNLRLEQSAACHCWADIFY